MNIDLHALKRTIKQHIWGPIGSIIFHVIAVVLLVVFATRPIADDPEDVPPIIIDTHTDALPAPPEPPETDPEFTSQPNNNTGIQPPTTANTTTETPGEDPGAGMGDPQNPGIGSDDAKVAPGFETALAQSPLVMRRLYASRTASGRGDARRKFNGSTTGEAAVIRALRWLKANQDPDGSWTQAETGKHAQWGPPAMASLALLCFLAHGETPSSQEFGQTVEKAMKYIASQQSSNGAFNKSWRGDGPHWVYQQGICTYAMSEAFGMTKIVALKDAMDKGIEFIIEGQQADGGYDYGFAKGTRFDLSVAGWQFQALKAARMAGCSSEKLDCAIKKSTQFLRTRAFVNNGFTYAPGTPPSPAMTSAGVLCLQLLGKSDTAEVRHGLKTLENFEKARTINCVWDKDPKTKKPVYAWYYTTQAKFQQGGADWRDWNKKFPRMLVQSQIVDKDKGVGHWDDGDWGDKVYTTTLCCLMMEVYYRYLPTFQHVESTPEPGATTTNDVVVMVTAR